MGREGLALVCSRLKSDGAMAAKETFAARWNRRKLEAKRDEAATDSPLADAAAWRETELPPKSASTNSAEGTAVAGEKPLPVLDDITPEGNIAAFLEKHIPADLHKLALRKAWTSDPLISAFVEMAENQYDWNTPGGCPGYGPLDPAWDLEQLLAQATGAQPKAETVAETAEAGPAGRDLSSKSTNSLEHDPTEEPRPFPSAVGSAAGEHTGSSTIQGTSSGERITGASTPDEVKPAAIDIPRKTQRHPPRQASQPRRHGGALPEL